MASSQELPLPELLRCYHCRVESNESSFEYFDNKKVDQPRYKCHHCHKFFTLGSHGRPQGKTYMKKRNEDPPELKTLPRQCRHCKVADNAVFKYYNNHNLSQPRFKCLSCKRQFQMRVLGTGEERRLVHTSFQQRLAPRRRKLQGVSDEPFPNPSSNSSEDGGGEDLQTYSNFLETELAEPEENYEANFTSWTGIGDSTTDSEVLPPLSGEDAQFLDLLEAEMLVPEENNYEAPNDAAFYSTANVATDALPPTWSIEDAELMGIMEAGASPDNEALMYADMPVSDNMAGEMGTEFTSNCNFDDEVMYGTLAPLESSPAAAACFEPEWTSWIQNDVDASVDSPFNWSYADAAAACCRQMDLEMAAEKNSMAQTAPSWTF